MHLEFRKTVVVKIQVDVVSWANSVKVKAFVVVEKRSCESEDLKLWGDLGDTVDLLLELENRGVRIGGYFGEALLFVNYRQLEIHCGASLALQGNEAFYIIT